MNRIKTIFIHLLKPAIDFGRFQERVVEELPNEKRQIDRKHAPIQDIIGVPEKRLASSHCQVVDGKEPKSC